MRLPQSKHFLKMNIYFRLIPKAVLRQFGYCSLSHLGFALLKQTRSAYWTQTQTTALKLSSLHNRLPSCFGKSSQQLFAFAPSHSLGPPLGVADEAGAALSAPFFYSPCCVVSSLDDLSFQYCLSTVACQQTSSCSGPFSLAKRSFLSTNFFLVKIKRSLHFFSTQDSPTNAHPSLLFHLWARIGFLARTPSASSRKKRSERLASPS